MSVGTAFHPRTAPLNRKMQWREWSGYFASRVYADSHDIEYNAIREAAAAHRRHPAVQVPRLRARRARASSTASSPATRRSSQVGQVYYTPWCDEHGKVIDDGTVHRARRATSYRWTAADPQLRWLTHERRRPRRARSRTSPRRSRRSRSRARSAAPCSRRPPASRSPTCATSAAAPRQIGRRRRSTSAATGYTGDLGYELWIPADAAPSTSGTRCSRPARPTRSGRPGMLALDVVRLEAGLILLEVDYTSARHAMNPEQNYSPFEIGLGRLVELRQGATSSAGARSRRSGAPAARPGDSSASSSTGTTSRGCSTRQGLPPAISPDRRSLAGARSSPAGRQVGRATSPRLEPDPQAGDRARVRAAALRARSAPSSRSSGRSRAAAAGSARRSSSCRSSTSRASGRSLAPWHPHRATGSGRRPRLGRGVPRRARFKARRPPRRAGPAAGPPDAHRRTRRRAGGPADLHRRRQTSGRSSHSTPPGSGRGSGRPCSMPSPRSPSRAAPHACG